ncbi:MAG: hypothetical protein KJ921_16650 [Proteobacteria bacterium]|nr:hypothetical protein [Pseudomonadota bacterium]
MSAEIACRIVKDYIDAFNADDVAAMTAVLNFPFAWLLGTKVIGVAKAEDFVPPTGKIRREEGWHHSVLDECTPLQVFEEKAHCKVVFSRFKADGTKYSTMEALWIVTNNNGHWGIQWMSR